MCCVLQGLLKLSGSSGVVPGHTKLKELLQMLFSRTRENPRGIYFKVTFLSPLFGTGVLCSLCRRADVDPESKVDAVRGCPSGVACRLEKEQCPTSRQGEGGREEGNESCCTQKGRHPRDRRPEPTVKAQRVFGTNKLADMAARWGGPFSHWFKEKTETKLEKTVGKALWLQQPCHPSPLAYI